MKKVLMITYPFPPMSVVGVYRSLKFCKFLPEFGWDPVVLTVKRARDWAYDESLLQQLPKEAKIYRTITLEPLSRYEQFRQRMQKGSGNNRCSEDETVLRKESRSLLQGARSYLAGWLSTPDKQALWFPFAVARGRAILKENQIEVIYTSSPPHSTHLIGYALKKLCNLPWVADFRDPWTLNEYFQEKPTTAKMKRLEVYLEELVIKGCDHLVANTESVSKAYKWRFNHLPKTKFSTIPNGYDPDDFEGLEPYDWDKFTITHLGSFYGHRHPIEFLKGLDLFLQRNPHAQKRLRVLFVGNMERETLDSIAQLGLSEMVECQTHQPHRQAMRLILSSHLLLLILGYHHGGAGIIPAKLFEYLYAGKPILALVSEGETANLIRTLHAGTAITSPNTQEIATALEKYYNRYMSGALPKSRIDSMGIGKYHRRSLTGQFAEILDSLLPQPPLEVVPRKRNLEPTYGLT